MKGYKEATRAQISREAKSEMDKVGVKYGDLAKLTGLSISHIKNAIHYNSITIKPDVYIKILSFLGIDVNVLYSIDGVSFFYKKLKDSK